MAFATSNVNLQSSGRLKQYFGDWSGSANDSPGSVTVEAGRVYAAVFNINPGSGPSQGIAIATWTPPTGNTLTTTITVNYHETVTNGTFIITYA